MVNSILFHFNLLFPSLHVIDKAELWNFGITVNFSTIASSYNERDLRGKLQELSFLSLDFPVHVYETVDSRGTPVYAIIFDGYLSKEEADKRTEYARKAGIAKDAYPWSSNIWGINIIDKFQ